MATQKQTYKTLRAFPHHGRVIPKGETLDLYPSQAKYLLGSHLTQVSAKKPAPKSKAKSTTTEGDQ